VYLLNSINECLFLFVLFQAGSFWRVIESHNVQTLFAAPTAVRAIKREDPYGELLKKYNISCLESLFLAG
jgi:propionyl-CoA synthetase